MSEKPDAIIAMWRTTTTGEGWFWRAYWYNQEGRVDHEKNGRFEGRSNLADETVTTRARAAAGFPGCRVVVHIKHPEPVMYLIDADTLDARRHATTDEIDAARKADKKKHDGAIEVGGRLYYVSRKPNEIVDP